MQRFYTLFVGLILLSGLLNAVAVHAQDVHIPDAVLAGAVREALGLAPDARLTPQVMLDLTRLEYVDSDRKIADLTGLEHATNLTRLWLSHNQISDLTPLENLNLIELGLWNNQVSDLMPVENLTNLTTLSLAYNQVSDLTPLGNLTNLMALWLNGNQVIDLTPLSNLTNLTTLQLDGNQVIDLTPLSNLTNLTALQLNGNRISDLTPLGGLTNLTSLSLWGNQISDATSVGNLTRLTQLNLGANQIIDITPLANLSGMTGWLNLRYNQIIDVTPLRNLTHLMELNLRYNQISDIASLGNLTNLTLLDIDYNQITDITPLLRLINLRRLALAGNPILDLLSPLEELLTQNPDLEVDLHPTPRITGPWLWMIAPTKAGQGGAHSTFVDSLTAASGGTVTETAVATNGAAEGDVVGGLVWTLGEIAAIGEDNINALVNRIGFAQGDVNDHSAYALITLESATVQSGVTMRVGTDDSIKVWLNGEVVHRNAIDRNAIGYQDSFAVDLIAGNNLLLVKVSERTGDWTMFVGIDADVTVVSKPQQPADVNNDGVVNIQDLVLVASRFGETGENDADVNGDGVVDIRDLIKVAAALDNAAAAPSLHPQALAMFTATDVRQWLSEAQSLNLTDITSQKGILFLTQLLAALIPKETALLANYPNPFNPETWIPYQLARPADVTLTIYAVSGRVVRQLSLGHQPAGIYKDKARAAYWDGRNSVGEPVASGVYFYTLTADDFTATRKLLIRK